MSKVPVYDFVWQQGTDGVISMRLVDELGVGRDLTNCKIRMDIKSDNGMLLWVFNNDDIDDSTIDLPGIDDNEAVLGSNGEINIIVPRLASIKEGPLLNQIGNILGYDIMLRSADNIQRKILTGTIVFEPSYTIWE